MFGLASKSCGAAISSLPCFEEKLARVRNIEQNQTTVTPMLLCLVPSLVDPVQLAFGSQEQALQLVWDFAYEITGAVLGSNNQDNKSVDNLIGACLRACLVSLSLSLSVFSASDCLSLPMVVAGRSRNALALQQAFEGISTAAAEQNNGRSIRFFPLINYLSRNSGAQSRAPMHMFTRLARTDSDLPSPLTSNFFKESVDL